MISKMTSSELNDIMLQAKDSIKSIQDNVNSIKAEMDKKLMIVNYDNAYTSLRVKEILTNVVQQVPGFKSFIKGCTGNYDSFGYSIHPKFLRSPLNVFNIELANGGIFFRDDVKVTIASIYIDKEKADTYDSYKDILKHDSLNKDIFFREFDTENIEIRISADELNPLGPTLFNTMEIDSYLPGSYDITDIVFSYYDTNGNENKNKSLKEVLYNYRDTAAMDILIQQAGQNRLILPKKVSLKDITIKIKLNYSFDKQGKKVYPFGLKHIYFYEADYNVSVTPKETGTIYGSYIIAAVTSDRNINKISDAITLRTTIGNIESTLTAEKIEIYLDNVSGVLDTPVYPEDEIPRNTNILYVKIPLTKLESNTGIVFNIENR